MFEKIAKNLTIGVIVLASFSSLRATEVLTEVKAAYFRPTNSLFREVYSGGGLYSVEASVQTCCKQLYPWASLGYFHTSGHCIGEEQPTNITIVPIGLGLKYLFSIDWSGPRPYLGAGMLVSYMQIHNKCSFVTQKESKWNIGGIIKAGFLSCITQCVFFDLFVDYSALFTSPEKFSVTKSLQLHLN